MTEYKIVRSNELRRRIKANDKEPIQQSFDKLLKSLDPRLPLGEYFEVGRFIKELRDYVLEEVE